jgi:hypothetical protein
MGVSVTGQHGISARSIRSFLVVVAVFTGFTTYFYGPAVTPGIRAAAAEACNEHAGGNFRSYRLSWESGPGSTPHWSCRDARRPAEPAVDLGWWVSPIR